MENEIVLNLNKEELQKLLELTNEVDRYIEKNLSGVLIRVCFSDFYFEEIIAGGLLKC
jgi:hypothetical protein